MSTSSKKPINAISNLRSKTGFEGQYKPPRSIKDQLALYNTPGMSIAIIDDYKIEWASGFGIYETGIDKAVKTTTLFQAASISKPIFALAVMRLVEEGKLNLDEDVNNYLTSWQVPMNGKWQPRLTLRHLLSHTGGVTVHGFQGYQPSDPIPTISEILNGEESSNSEKIEVNILPGLQFSYSGGGITIAQQVIEDVLNKPFTTIMEELVLDPLGMKNSTFNRPSDNWKARCATGHTLNGVPLSEKYNIHPELAAAGLWTTASDLAVAGVELLQVLRGKSSSFLSVEMVESMLTPQLINQNDNSEYYGLGFFCSGSKSGFRFSHGGWNEGFIADFNICKNSGKGVVIMLNSNEGEPLLEEVVRSVSLEYDWPTLSPPKTRIIDFEPTLDYTGEYKTDFDLTFLVAKKGNTFMLKLASQPDLILYPISIYKFYAEATNTSVLFRVNKSQKIVSISVSQAGQDFNAIKVH